MKQLRKIFLLIALLCVHTAYALSEDSLLQNVAASITQADIDSMVANPPPADEQMGWIAFYKQAKITQAPQLSMYGKCMVAYYRYIQLNSPAVLWCGIGAAASTDPVAETLSMYLEAIASEWAEEGFVAFN